MCETLVTPSKLAQYLADPDWRVIDCRFDLADPGAGARSYAQAHIPGAIHADLDQVLSSPITASSGRHPLPDPARLCAWLGEMGIHNDQQVVVYDASGGAMAVRLWWLLHWLGHRKVALLDGGWPAWQRAGLPWQEQVPEFAPADFHGTPAEGMLVETGHIVEALGTETWLLVDARTAERYRGEHEPIDPVAGHIPGAVSLPLQAHLNPDGTFKDATELLALYRPLLDGRPTDQLVSYCGSGVSACHHLLAMRIAGLPGGRLYAGSWSEWIRDPQRPVARD